MALLARKRGIILSSDDSREDLAKYLSLLTFDYRQMCELVDFASNKEREDRKSLTTFEATSKIEDIASAAEKLKSDRGPRHGEVYNITQVSSTRIMIEIKYSELDYSKTRLSQRQPREIKIEIDLVKDGFQTRYDANERARQIVQDFAALMAGAVPQEIVLKSLTTAAGRTQFFINLIKGIKGFKLDNVTTARCSLMPSADSSALDDEDEELLSEERSHLEEKLTSTIKNIQLSGDLVHSSDEFVSAKDKGLYVNHLVWTSSEQKRKVIFEAGFGDENHEGEFRYDIRGIYERKADGQYRRTKASVKLGEKLPLLKLIEAAAEDALKVALVEQSTRTTTGAGTVTVATPGAPGNATGGVSASTPTGTAASATTPSAPKAAASGAATSTAAGPGTAGSAATPGAPGAAASTSTPASAGTAASATTPSAPGATASTSTPTGPGTATAVTSSALGAAAGVASTSTPASARTAASAATPSAPGAVASTSTPAGPGTATAADAKGPKVRGH